MCIVAEMFLRGKYELCVSVLVATLLIVMSSYEAYILT